MYAKHRSLGHHGHNELWKRLSRLAQTPTHGVVVATCIALGLYLILILFLHFWTPETHIDWSTIELQDVHFPESFAWGVATVRHQIEGMNTNNWSQFEEAKDLQRSGDACDHWNRWKSQIST